MTVLVLENYPPGFRGEITQWLLEVKAGVYVGNISAKIRELLWKKVCDTSSDGSGLLIYTAPTEQGFLMETYNLPDRKPIDMEGILLIARSIV